ncbi:MULTISPECIES: hypothetical protein [Arthrobacter]|nr:MULTISPECIES: hypothetical protein [Arthrobacter]
MTVVTAAIVGTFPFSPVATDVASGAVVGVGVGVSGSADEAPGGGDVC